MITFQALTAADLNLVVFVCENVDSDEVFSSTNTPLAQPVLLSLIQQLSVDLLNNTDLKHKYVLGSNNLVNLIVAVIRLTANVFQKL